MTTKYFSIRISATILLLVIFLTNSTQAQLYGFMLSPSGTTTDFMKFVPKGFGVNGTNYVTGYLSLSAYMNVTTQQYTDPGFPLQKLQLQGGNILLCRTSYAPNSPDLNPTSRNGAILFSDMVTTENNWIHGKWGIEYDDQYSTGGLNFFKPISSLTNSRINFNFFIRNDGNVGIGTSAPLAKLQVADGDIFIQDINKGIIMKSPDGSCWRGTMNNSGQLEFEKLADCENLVTKTTGSTEINSIQVFPNPARDYFEVKCPEADCRKYNTISLFGTNGNQVLSLAFTSATMRISTESLKPGSYILKLQGSKDSFTDTIVVIH